MDFDFTREEQNFFNELRETMQRFSQDRDLEGEDAGQITKNISDALLSLAPTGYFNPGLQDAGPVRGGMSALMGAMEILSDISPSLYLSVEMSARLFGRIIHVLGTDAHKAKWLAPLVKGELLGAVALSEDSMNIENDPFRSEGVRSGDDVIVNGGKRYVVNGPIADGFAVAGRMDGENVIFLVGKETAGLERLPRLKSVGYAGALISNIEFKDCRIPTNQVLGPFAGRNILNTIRLWENQILIGGCLGMMKSSFEEAKAYAASHKTGGKPIMKYQEVSFKLSEMLTLYQTSQLFAQRAAWTATADPKEAESLTWCAKVFCTEAAERVAGDALRILAGEGLMAGNKSETAHRCAKYGQIAGTSTEIARVRIGDAALGIRS